MHVITFFVVITIGMMVGFAMAESCKQGQYGGPCDESNLNVCCDGICCTGNSLASAVCCVNTGGSFCWSESCPSYKMFDSNATIIYRYKTNRVRSLK